MRPIDADALMEQVCLEGDCTQCKTGVNEKVCKWNMFRLKDVIDCLEHAPTIDAVPVVRCKDCVYRVIVRDPLMKTMDCYGCKVMHYNEDDWFCSFGERKDDGRTCDTCKHYDKGWDDIVCDGCTKAHSNWERRDDD